MVFGTVLMGCATPPDPLVIPAVCRWRNTTALDGPEQAAISTHRLQRVYHKVLDIDWNGRHGAHPVSVVPVTKDMYPAGIEIIPAIYITERTFRELDDTDTDTLASQLRKKLRKECAADIHGLLLDCDWTATTRDRFFRLAGLLRDSLRIPIISTIRLHQYAHPARTGVPPVDRGLLMPYNIGSVKEPAETHSIFDPEKAKAYFQGKEPYPLPLDIVLPAFSWAAQFRKGRFMGVVQETMLNEALERGLLAGDPDGAMQVVREDNDHLPALHLGDVLRVERMTPARINAATRLAQRARNSDTLAVAFFELGTPTFLCLPATFVDSTFRAFGTVRAVSPPLP